MNQKSQVEVKSNLAPRGAMGGILQRKCGCGQHSISGSECNQCSKNHLSLQRSTKNTDFKTRNSASAWPAVQAVLRSPGRPLDSATRAFMEPRFGRDFSRVWIHTGVQAAESARAVNAAAYTVGPHVVFGEGRYTPYTSAGQRLIAHELTHTIQQRGDASSTTDALEVSQPNDSYEQEADRLTDRVLAAPAESAVGAEPQPFSVSSSPLRVGPVRLARQEESSPVTPPSLVLPSEGGATPMASGPECSRARSWGQSMPWPNQSFSGDRGFAYIPADGYPGGGGLLVTGTSVTIRITARWEEQIPDPADRPSDQRSRRADRPQYYLTWDGWVDDCDVTRAGSSASNVRSGNLSIGTEHTLRFQNLIPGRYGLQINPSTASAEPNRVLTGMCEIT